MAGLHAPPRGEQDTSAHRAPLVLARNQALLAPLRSVRWPARAERHRSAHRWPATSLPAAIRAAEPWSARAVLVEITGPAGGRWLVGDGTPGATVRAAPVSYLCPASPSLRLDPPSC